MFSILHTIRDSVSKKCFELYDDLNRSSTDFLHRESRVLRNLHHRAFFLPSNIIQNIGGIFGRIAFATAPEGCPKCECYPCMCHLHQEPWHGVKKPDFMKNGFGNFAESDRSAAEMLDDCDDD